MRFVLPLLLSATLVLTTACGVLGLSSVVQFVQQLLEISPNSGPVEGGNKIEFSPMAGSDYLFSIAKDASKVASLDGSKNQLVQEVQTVMIGEDTEPQIPIEGNDPFHFSIIAPRSKKPGQVTVYFLGEKIGKIPVGTYKYTGDISLTEGPAPVLTALSPSTGPASGGGSTIVSGENFQRATKVYFGNAPAETLYVSPEKLIVTVPGVGPLAQDTLVKVSVINSNGETAVLENGFTYQASPVQLALSAVSPNSGPQGGGTLLHINGVGISNSSVSIGGVSATVINWNPTSIYAVSPPSTTSGSADIQVRNDDGQVASLTGAFYYQANAVGAPLISSVNPGNFTTVGGTVSVNGQNFAAGTKLYFDSVEISSTIVNANLISAVLPASAEGAHLLTAENAAGSSSSGINYYKVVNFTVDPQDLIAGERNNVLVSGDVVGVTQIFEIPLSGSPREIAFNRVGGNALAFVSENYQVGQVVFGFRTAYAGPDIMKTVRVVMRAVNSTGNCQLSTLALWGRGIVCATQD